MEWGKAPVDWARQADRKDAVVALRVEAVHRGVVGGRGSAAPLSTFLEAALGKTEAEVRKYAYAMQIEVQRLAREEQASDKLRADLRRLLDDHPKEAEAGHTGALSPSELAGLVPAMKLEGMVRYGLPYATANTAWDALRSNHPEFAERTDAELFEAFQQTGQGITSTFGDLW